MYIIENAKMRSVLNIGTDQYSLMKMHQSVLIPFYNEKYWHHITKTGQFINVDLWLLQYCFQVSSHSNTVVVTAESADFFVSITNTKNRGCSGKMVNFESCYLGPENQEYESNGVCDDDYKFWSEKID